MDLIPFELESVYYTSKSAANYAKKKSKDIISKILTHIAENPENCVDFCNNLKFKLSSTKLKKPEYIKPVQYNLGSEIINGVDKSAFMTVIPLREIVKKRFENNFPNECELILYADEITLTGPIGIDLTFEVMYSNSKTCN